MEKLTLAQAIRKHLSLPHETVSEVMANVKALTPQDKLDLARYFGDVDIQIVAPSGQPSA